MSYRISLLIVLTFSVLMVLGGLFSMSDYPNLKGFCNEATPSYVNESGRVNLSEVPDNWCSDFSANYGAPLFLGGIGLGLCSLILLFAREETFKSWRKFAYWAVPISVILLWIAPTTSPGGFGISYFNYTKESASWLVSGAFLLISLYIIVRAHFKRPRSIS